MSHAGLIDKNAVCFQSRNALQLLHFWNVDIPLAQGAAVPLVLSREMVAIYSEHRATFSKRVRVVPPVSHGVSRVPRYSGFSRTAFSFGYGALTLCGGPSQTLLLDNFR